VNINPQQLIQAGKLEPHCQDLRVVIGTTPVSYDLSNAPQNCPSTSDMEVTFTVNNLAVNKYRTYLYYGNPTADNQSVSIISGAPESPLEDEEEIGVPR